MRGPRAALGAVLLGALTALAGVVTPTTAVADDPELTPVERFSSCVAGGGQGNLLLMFDTSGSLADTDPDAGRVTAATATMTRLAAKLAEVPDSTVDVAVSGFSTGFATSLGWTALSTQSAPTINAAIEAYADRDRDVDTDYWSAMDGARRAFSERIATQENPCNLLMWFSDGEFNLNVRDNDSKLQRWGGLKPWAPDNKLANRAQVTQALEAGRSDLCRPGGLADQLRSLDVATIGLGLAVDLEPSAFDLMRGITTGSASCGQITQPTPGEFIMASDVDDLIFAFITALDPVTEPTTTQPCVDTECAEGTRTFVLDGSIGAVNATAKTPLDGTRILLRTRTGDSIELTQGTGEQNLGGSTLAWEWLTPQVLTFDLTRVDADDWAGPWGIVFIASEATDELAKSTITLKGDIAPTLVDRAVRLQIGAEPVALQLGTVDRNGARIDPETLSEETVLSARLIAGEETMTLAEDLTKGDIEVPIPVDVDDLQPGIAELVLTLDVTTQAWTENGVTTPGTRLEPRHASFPIVIAPPVDFPSIPARISFGSTEKPDPVTVLLPITGEGCAWLSGDTTFTGYPDGLDNAQLTSPAAGRDSCAKGNLELTLDPGGLGNGSLVGTTKVMLAAADSSAEPIAVDLAFDLSQSRPASQPVLWGTLILVTLLGVAIPVGILYLVKYLTATIPGTAVLAGTVSGPVDDAHAFTDAGVPLDVTRLQMAHLTDRRQVTVAGRTLHAKMGAALTEPGYVVVATPGPSAGGRGTLQSVRGDARLPLAVQGNWMVALDPQRPGSGPVEITVFTAPGAPGFADLLDDVRANIRVAVARLREGLPPDAGPAAPAADPWGAPRPGGQTPPTDPWANPPGGSRPTTGPSSW